MSLITIVIEICCFRRGPQDFPYAGSVLKTVIAADVGISSLLGLFDMELPAALGQSLLVVGLLSAYLWGCLQLVGKQARFLQTVGAAIASDALTSLIAVVVLGFARLVAIPAPLLGMELLVLMAWQVVIIGHILRHALDISVFSGLGLSLAYTAFNYGLLMELFDWLS